MQCQTRLLKTTALLTVFGCGIIAFPTAAEASSFFSAHSFIQPELQSALKYSASNSSKEKGAENFVENLTQRGISFLSSDDLSQEQRKKEFESLLNDTFDIKTIARFSLGRYWRSATKDEKKEYMRLFKKMILEVYSNRFGEYQGQEMQVRSSRADNEKDSIVSSFIIPNEGGQEIRVDWRIRYKNGQYKVIDVIVEGVSMSLTQRSDFASVIQRGGGKVSVLLDHMR